MSDMDTKQIRSLFDKLSSDAKTTHGLWEEISKYMKPQRLGMQTMLSPGSDLTQWMYDGTALVAAKDWADAVHFATANPFMQWFMLEYVQPENDDTPQAVTDWCQDVSGIMGKHMADSNFTASTNEAVQDWGLYGNCSVQCHKAPGERFKLAFESLHIRDVVPLIGAHGRISTTIGKFKMTVQAMAEQFAKEEWDAGNIDALEDKLGKRAAKALKAGKLGEEVWVLHTVFERPKSDVNLDENTGMAKPEERPFGSIWLVYDEEAKPLKIGGYYEQPRFWARMRRRTDDPMGGGLGEVALPDTYSANEWRRLILNAADKEIDPPWIEESEQLLNNPDQRARGVTTVRDIDKVKQVQIQARTLAQMVGNDIRQTIRDIWMSDEIKLPPRERVGQMTAYEVSKRIERIYQLMGPEIDRLHSELFRPLLERVFGLLLREGLLPEMPEEMAERGGKLEFKFLGPAVRSQYGEELAAMDDHIAYVVQLSEIDPSVLDTIDLDAHLKRRAEIAGYPMDLMREEDEKQQIREERAKTLQAQQSAAVAKDASQAVKNMGGPQNMPPELEVLTGGA